MSLLLLLRTNAFGTPYASYWSDHFPRKSMGHSSHWNFHFPDTLSLDVPGTDPQGVATFVLESDAQVTFAWRTGVFKSYSGKERRQNLIDDPAIRFEGKALLVGSRLRAVRSRIAQYAATGRAFQLGLPYEALTLRAASPATTVAVHSTTRADWAVPGQRVVVRRFDGSAYQYVEAVIQSVTSTTITIDETLGAVGALGAEIMPTIAVYLEPQQGFQRYVTPDGVEHWNIRARSAVAGFTSVALTAQLALAGTAVGVVFYAPTAGVAGNSLQIQFVGDATTIDSVDTSTPNLLVYHFVPGVTTVLEMCSRIERTDFVRVTPFNPADRSTSALQLTDAFAATALSGGADAAHCSWGLTATLTTFMGSPVWDRGVAVSGTADDSVHTMAEVQDLGGLPFAAGSAAVPDWGRRIALSRALLVEWQWAKKFLDTVKGRWKSFWLPTYRPDLVPVSKAAGTLTVESGESDVFAWWPLQRTTLAVRYTSGTWVYLQIADATDNFDGTVTLDITDEDDNPVTLASVPELVCWLERCRLESDEVGIAFTDARFSVSMLGRAVQQAAEGTVDDFDSAESSVESGQPREGVKIETPAATYRYTGGTRTLTIDGETYNPIPIGREELRLTTVGEDGALSIHLPASNTLVQRWLALGVPPRDVTVTVYRQHSVGDPEPVFRGVITSVAGQGHVVQCNVEARASITHGRRLPTITAGKTCPHILYDSGSCRVTRASFETSTTVASYNGREITVVDSIGASGLKKYGELVHTASGERFTILSHVGKTVTLQVPIYGLAIGDAVVIAHGCDHTVATCRDTFNNVANFGGFPNKSGHNIFDPTTLGLLERP